jgi:hypothetical protein
MGSRSVQTGLHSHLSSGQRIEEIRGIVGVRAGVMSKLKNDPSVAGARVAQRKGAAFDWHRLTLTQLAAALAAPALAARGIVPLSRLGIEAMATRVVHARYPRCFGPICGRSTRARRNSKTGLGSHNHQRTLRLVLLARICEPPGLPFAS